jgi:O-antigen biosynthesis protein WbqP
MKMAIAAGQALAKTTNPDVRLPGPAYRFFKRAFDFITALLLLILLGVPMLLVAMTIRLTSKGPALYWSNRVGIDNQIFKMPKFRSMRMNAPQLATHLFRDPDAYVTPIGRLLRKTSLDELPQLLSILKGDISFVGPRPALFNQDDLVALRTERGVHRLMPGLTGWAQINGRDSIPIPVKVDFDTYYLNHCSFWFDMKILCMTVFKVLRTENVSH